MRGVHQWNFVLQPMMAQPGMQPMMAQPMMPAAPHPSVFQGNFRLKILSIKTVQRDVVCLEWMQGSNAKK